MSIGISSDQRELADALAAWASGLKPLDAVRGAEQQPTATFDTIWASVVSQGVASIVLPEAIGGGGGSALDAAVAVEAASTAALPGHLLSTTAASFLLADSEIAKSLASGARAALALDACLSVGDRLTGSAPVVVDAVGADWLILGGLDGDRERWFAVPADRVAVEAQIGLDLTHRAGAVSVDASLADLIEVPLSGADVRRALLTFAAAEAAGIAQWCLGTAVDYARVREQFGQPIGRFQAIKQLCAQMLETTEAVKAAAWDVASAAGAEGAEQFAFAANVAGAIALDGAVRVAQDCIQVLGGIGFTFEHDAHFYLRRAVALRSLLGSGDRHARALAQQAIGGLRREISVDLEGRDAEIRAEIARVLAEIARLPERDRRNALAANGLIAPHWPAPYGRDADAVEQIVIDQELAAAGIALPDIKIGAWAVPTILAHGSDAQRERFVRPTLEGDIVWCQLFSEPGAGSDLASLRTRAVRVPSTGSGEQAGWRLTGQKVWTSLAHEADWGICLARTNPEAPQHKGITYFLIDMKSPGIDVRPLREMTGDALFNEVFLDDVFVPDEMVVGEVDGGWRLARTTLANERVAMAGTKLSLSAERAVALASDADSDQLARVGHAAALSTVCALLDVRTTLRSLAGEGPGPESSVAKLLTVRARQDASELVVDLLGARALLDEPDVCDDVHEMLLTRCLSIAGGTTQILRNVAAERILGLPR